MRARRPIWPPHSGSIAGFIGPAFRWDILNYGRIENNVRVQEARFHELVYAYQDTVLRAGREAEDAAVGFLRDPQGHLGQFTRFHRMDQRPRRVVDPVHVFRLLVG